MRPVSLTPFVNVPVGIFVGIYVFAKVVRLISGKIMKRKTLPLLAGCHHFCFSSHAMTEVMT